MSKVFIGIIFVLTCITYYLFNQNQTLSANNIALEGAVATQKEAIEHYKMILPYRQVVY